MILDLIDKQDTFEIVRDQIAAILATESANQVILAAGEPDPSDWAFDVFTERSNPFDRFLEAEKAVDKTPIVHVWYETSTFDRGASDVVKTQKADGSFNIDIYGYGETHFTDTTQTPGDKEAILETQRVVRLIRNILMAAEYTYLGLRGVVWGKWINSVQMFQPEIDGQTVQKISGARIRLDVQFSETSPQIAGVDLDLISACVKRTEDGMIIVEADYDQTP